MGQVVNHRTIRGNQPELGGRLRRKHLPPITEDMLATQLRRDLSLSRMSAWQELENKYVSDVIWGPCTFQGTSIVLVWNPATGKDIDYYEIRTDLNFGSVDSGLVTRVSGTRYEITNPSERSYTFYIKAHTRAGNYSIMASSITLENPPPPAPDQPAVTAFFTALWIEIKPVPDGDLLGYYLYITPSDGNGHPLDGAVTAKIRLGFVTKYTYQASPGSHFLIEVTAFDGLGEGPKSQVLEASTLYITGDVIEPGSIRSDHIDIGAITEAKMNWQTHLIF